MTIRRFTTSDGREGAQFSDGWTIAREPGTPGADLATSAEALCEDGTQITWLDAEPAPPAELTEAQPDTPPAMILVDSDGELCLACRRCHRRLKSIADETGLDALVAAARLHECPEPAATPEQDGEQPTTPTTPTT